MGQKNTKEKEKLTGGKVLAISIGVVLLVLGVMTFVQVYLPLIASNIAGLLLAIVGAFILLGAMSDEEVVTAD